jgi:hypothetical protein
MILLCLIWYNQKLIESRGHDRFIDDYVALVIDGAIQVAWEIH